MSKENVNPPSALGRGAVGLGLGWMGCALAALLWSMIGFQSDSPKNDHDLLRSSLLSGTFLGAMSASWIGSIAGAVAYRRGNWNKVILCAIFGSGLGVVLGAVFGLASAWTGWEYDHRSMVAVWAPFAASLPAGMLGGWLAARLMQKLGA